MVRRLAVGWAVGDLVVGCGPVFSPHHSRCRWWFIGRLGGLLGGWLGGPHPHPRPLPGPVRCSAEGPSTRELHTGLSPDKFALCSPRTGHPGQPVPTKPERKKNGRPFVRWPTGQIRTSSARPFPDRSAMAEAGPSGPSSRSSSPKSSQAARQKGCRAPSRCSPRPLICPGRSRAPKAQEGEGRHRLHH